METITIQVSDAKQIQELTAELASLARRFCQKNSKYGTEEEVDSKLEDIYRILSAAF